MRMSPANGASPACIRPNGIRRYFAIQIRKKCRPRCKQGLLNTICDEDTDSDSGAILREVLKGRKKAAGKLGTPRHLTRFLLLGGAGECL